ncbi:hypothetical protein QUH73_20240, partial [Labilibaculum sp. K2S]|uniref:hypothetical protein n=1 Tax=Labilibaculum sp. K2S TaxID=3056386 RepID=UPI0025A4C77F
EDLFIKGVDGDWIRKSDLRKDVKGTYNSQGAKTIQSYLQAGFDIQFRFNGTYNYALAIYGGKTLGSAAGVIWNSSFSHFGMHNGFNKGVNSFSVGASNEGYRYGNPLADIVTVGGSIASYYKNLPQKMAPIISKHFGGVDFKYGKTVGRLGTLGDVASTVGAINNLTNDPKSVENWADGVFAGAGWIPIYGDYGALLYTSAKSQIPIIQKNIMENKPTLNGVYNPATGDVWYGY